jgi:hypothetical protein
VNSSVTTLVVGVTSHRNIATDEIDPIRQLVRNFFLRLQYEFPSLPLVVLSALAEGGDQWAAEEALTVGARLIAPLPMAREHYAKDFIDGTARAQFNSLCDKSEIIVVPDVGGNVSSMRNVVPVGQERDLHYAQAGVYVSDHCHILLTIWDGKPSNLLGGTAQIAQYHLTGAKPSQAERRRRETRSLLGNESERLAYHIVCTRDQFDGAPSPTLQPLQTFWRTGARILPGDDAMPKEFSEGFAHAGEFNTDSNKYSAGIGLHAGASEIDDKVSSRSNDGIDRVFTAADWLAIHFQRRVLLSMRALYTLAALMGIAFTVYDNLPAQDNMIFVFLLLFALGGFVVVLANRRGWHRKYLDYRALAEGLRVQAYWNRAGLSLAGDVEFARDNFLQKQDVELGWVRNVMRGAELENAAQNATPMTPDVRGVIREWIGDSQHHGQLDYYERKAEQRARTHSFTETIGFASLCVGVGISVVLAVFARQLSPDAKNTLVVIMAVFSIVAGVRAAYAYKKADKELIKQYRYMRRIFDEARKALDGTESEDEQREILRLLGEAALAEQVEWALMHRQRPLEHNRL